MPLKDKAHDPPQKSSDSPIIEQINSDRVLSGNSTKTNEWAGTQQHGHDVAERDVVEGQTQSPMTRPDTIECALFDPRYVKHKNGPN